MSFTDDIAALIDRPCQYATCGRIVPESSPSDDFCSENCEEAWRAENNGLTTTDHGDFGVELHIPADHPAAPSYSPPEEDERPPRSFLEHIQRQLTRLWDRLFADDVERFQQNVTGILSGPEIRGNRQHYPAVGLMQIMHSGRAELPVRPSEDFTRFLDQYGMTPRVWSQPGTSQAPAVPPSEDEVRRMREQIARLFQVPPAILEPPPPPPSVADAVGFEVITDPLVPPGYAFVRPREQVHFHAALDPGVPDAEPVFYTREERYDPQSNRVVFELRAHRPLWVNVQFEGLRFIESLHAHRAAAAERDRLLHGEWTDERLEGAGLEQLAEVVEDEPDIPPYRDQSET